MASIRTAAAAVWDTSLGWMALLADEDAIFGLTFGHADPGQAVGSLGRCGLYPSAMPAQPDLFAADEEPQWLGPWRERLAAYADGQPDDFLDAPLHLDHLTDFQRRVVQNCRQIPYGDVLTYGQLAARSGSPGAARAVGTTMSQNRFPIIVPCHRVIASAGKIGGYSGADGLDTKRRLLRMEGSLTRAPQPLA